MAELNYTKSHEWVLFADDGSAKIGLSEYAIEQLGDIVYVNPGEIGDELVEGESFGDIESVKSVGELIAPLSGVIKEVNEALVEEPELINEDPLTAWLICLSEANGGDNLMDEGEYQRYIEEL